MIQHPGPWGSACALLCVLFCAACGGADDEFDEAIAVPTGENRPLTPAYERPPEPNPCIEILTLPTDEGPVTIVVPLPCPIPEIDRGDPPPDAVMNDAVARPAEQANDPERLLHDPARLVGTTDAPPHPHWP